ncbi:transposase InsO family protein [Bradyrhizobium sp. USDA 4501]
MKTFKRDDVRVIPIPDAHTALLPIDHWMVDYNSERAHSRLGYRSRREYIASLKPAESGLAAATAQCHKS